MEKIPQPTFERLSQEEKRRLAVIQERQDLFETKLYHFGRREQNRGGDKDETPVLFLLRDPGSAQSILPVMEVFDHEGSNIDVLVDGAAEDILLKHSSLGPKASLESTESPLTFSSLEPRAIVTAFDTEKGIESFSRMNFSAPIVYVEDVYGKAEKYMAFCIEKHIPFPERICVIDEFSRKTLVARYPELTDRVRVTGQPAFDKLSTEQRESTRKEIRSRLNLKKEEKLVLFSASPNIIATLREISAKLGELDNEHIRFAFRPHPRDQVPMVTYKEILDSASVKALPLEQVKIYSENDISLAADVLIFTHSTSTYPAIYRRQAVMNITAPGSNTIRSAIQPALETGASIEVSNMEEFPESIQQLLDPRSDMRKKLKAAQVKNFRLDGKNTERVMAVIQEVT